MSKSVMFAVIKIVRLMPKSLVTGLFAWGLASHVFGSELGGIVITKTKMDPILMQGGEVVKGKDYSIDVSYILTKCNGCSDPYVRLTVSDVPLPASQKSCSKHSLSSYPQYLIPTTRELAKAFSKIFKVDNEFLLMDTPGKFPWSQYSTPRDNHIITLQKIKDKPKTFYVWVLYRDVVYHKHWIVCYADNRVEITEESKDKVRISGLEDAKLGTDGKFTLDKVCVYSSTGKASLHFDGGKLKKEEPFNLILSETTASNTSSIPYTITVKSNGISLGPIDHDGNTRTWVVDKADQQGNCGNVPNMVFIIQASKEAMNAARDGVYRDTMTITVAPK